MILSWSENLEGSAESISMVPAATATAMLMPGSVSPDCARKMLAVAWPASICHFALCAGTLAKVSTERPNRSGNCAADFILSGGLVTKHPIDVSSPAIRELRKLLYRSRHYLIGFFLSELVAHPNLLATVGKSKAARRVTPSSLLRRNETRISDSVHPKNSRPRNAQ